MPPLAIGAQAAFVWAAIDPVSLVETMRVLAVVPEPLWYIWMGIWAFYFTGRILENAPKKWKIEPRALEIAKEIAAERAARRQAEQFSCWFDAQAEWVRFVDERNEKFAACLDVAKRMARQSG